MNDETTADDDYPVCADCGADLPASGRCEAGCTDAHLERIAGGRLRHASVWLVLWHDRRRGDRNCGVHGVFTDEAMARESVDKMNASEDAFYWAVSYLVIPGARTCGEIGTHVHLDARPDHVRRAEDEAWREHEKQERARI